MWQLVVVSVRMSISFPSYEQLQARHTMKWTRYPEDVIPLWVAESDFGTCPPVKDALVKAIERETFGYQPDNPGLPKATADFYRERYGFNANPQWIFAVPDVVRALEIAIAWFTPEGSKVIVPVPAYPPFMGLLGATKREGVFIDATGGLDLGEVEKGFQDGARSIILCNPFNPLGFIFDEEYLRELCELADRYDARVLVDEIHAPLVYRGLHVVAAGVSDTAARVCITTTATSKAWNTAGLKCAQILFSNADDVKRWAQLSPVTKDGVSTIGLIAAETAYRLGGEFLEEEIAYLKANYEYLKEELPQAVPGIKVPEMDATYLMWLDCREVALPGGATNPSRFFLEHAKVMMNDGVWFGEQFAGFVRLNFATSREILERAVAQMAESLSS